MTTITEYVAGRLQAGRSRAEIHDELTAVGWTDGAAESAYRDGLIALGAPVPDHDGPSPSSPRVSTSDIAANLFALVLLGIVIGSALVLFFELINRAFPDPVESSYELPLASARRLQHATASLAIAFPLYVLAMRWWLACFSGEQERAEGKLTQWLTYLVLLLAAVTIVCDLIALLSALLQGEMTTRLLLKAGAVLCVAALVFGFYMLERRLVHYHRTVAPRLFKGMLALSGALLAAGMTAGLLAAGSPQHSRSMMLDDQRSAELNALSDCVERFAERFGQLPESLDMLAKTGEFAGCRMTDPETRQRYGYRVISAATTIGQVRVGEFELCASFAQARTQGYAIGPVDGPSWHLHGAGRQCWSRYAGLGNAKDGAAAR